MALETQHVSLVWTTSLTPASAAMTYRDPLRGVLRIALAVWLDYVFLHASHERHL